MNVLVTGGAGYIGSHTIVELLNLGHSVVAVDNLTTSSQRSFDAVQTITGKTVHFYNIDCRDKVALTKVFDQHQVDYVIHLAALKSVGESMQDPLRYYDNNVGSVIALLNVMRGHGVQKLVFSSSCTVYGTAKELPVSESAPVGGLIASAYGRTKYISEEILKDIAAADAAWQITALRYFNVVGAHSSGRIGEDPNGTPNFLMPYIAQVAVGRREKLRIFGNDYATPDGTCIRDYIHVSDIANGHVAAMTHLKPGFDVYNLGTGKGVSVLEMIRAFERASGKQIPYEFAPRRPGDVPSTYADPSKANRELGWTAAKTIEEICADIWRWQSSHPNGFSS